MAKLTYIKAITDGLDVVLGEDPKTLIFGEDVGKNGGVFRTTEAFKISMVKTEFSIHPLRNLGF